MDDLATSARQGQSGALVLYGDAGMGKTALLDYAGAIRGFRVVRTGGIETEQEFGFAALHRLLLPFLDALDHLPEPQQTAIEGAFGMRDKGPSDRFMVGLAALSVLAAESAKGPLLCLIDDAQWIDTESLLTLAFVGRRIRAEGIVLLFAVRTPLDVPSELAGIPSMEVTGLPMEAATDLLGRAAGRQLGTEVSRRVVAEMNGCPLALWELGKDLAETYLADARVAIERITVNHRLEDHFFQQLTRLGSDAQLLLLTAAADTSGDRALVWSVARDLGCSVDAQLEAEDERLLLPGNELRFRHPLIRSTVYVRADPEQRRLVHRALAKAMGRTAFPDRWARHVALGAEGPSEQLASELEDMSHLAQARGGYGAQATLLVQAANLSESLVSRSLRLLNAARATLNVGAHQYVSELLDQAEPYVSEPLALAEIDQLRAHVSIGVGQPAKAPALLLRSAQAFMQLDIGRARNVLLQAFDAHIISGHFTEAVSPNDIAEAVKKTGGPGETIQLQDHWLEGITAIYDGDRPRGYEHFRKGADLIRTDQVEDEVMGKWVAIAPSVFLEMFDDSTYDLWVARADAYARRNGALYLLLFNLFSQMHADTRAGRLRSAAGRHAEGLDVTAAIGIPVEYNLPLDIVLRAWVGDEEGTRDRAAAIFEVNSAIGSDLIIVVAHLALAILHLGAARYEDALAEADEICTREVIGFPAEALPIAVEAAIRSAHIERAERALADLEVRAKASNTPWALGLLARSKALVSDSSESERYYVEAINLLGQTSIVTDVARTRLLYGEWLRRQRRIMEARQQLRMSLKYFAEIGASGFAQRAQSELLATGERARARSVEHGTDLTARERRVAELAAEGLSNREIASQLFISSTTVEYHLRKVFRKLGISSRGRLAGALASGMAAAPRPTDR